MLSIEATLVHHCEIAVLKDATFPAEPPICERDRLYLRVLLSIASWLGTVWLTIIQITFVIAIYNYNSPR